MICRQKAVSLCIFLIFLSFLYTTQPADAESINPFESKQDVSPAQSGAFKDSNQSTVYIPKKGKADNETATIAVLSDLHVRDDNYDMLMLAIKAINSLPDIYAVAITGDLCRKIGSPAEYSHVIHALSRLSVPVLAVPGNHDVRYRDHFSKGNKKLLAGPAEKKAKLERFRKAFKLRSLRYTRKIGGHLLVFLPNDELVGKLMVQISNETLEFLRKTLKENRDLPTIVFCHAPLKGSYVKERGLPLPHTIAQPAGKIQNILDHNPQVFLWVAGHLHMAPGSKDYFAKANKVGKVTVINVPAIMPHSSWVHTIKLSPEKAVVRTYNPKTKKYVKKYDRVFIHKKKSHGSGSSGQNGSQSGNSSDDGQQAPDTVEETASDSHETPDTIDETSSDSQENEEDMEESDDAEQEAGDESDDNQPESSNTTDTSAADLIKDLIKAIDKLLNGLWTGLLKILKI